MAHVNRPAFKDRLSERHEDLAVPLAQNPVRSLATAAGSVRGEVRVEGRCLGDPDALHQLKTRAVNKRKTLLGRARLYLRSRIRIGADIGWIRTPPSRSRSQKISATLLPNWPF